MSSREFAEWMAYASLEPFGEERADLRAAIIASVMANAHRDPKKKSKPFEVADFMPQFEEKQGPSADVLLEKVKMINALLGGKDLRDSSGDT